VIVCGAVTTEAIEAVARLGERHARLGLMVVTSADRLHAGWLADPGDSHIDRLSAPLARDAALVTAIDGHPATLSWLGDARPAHRPLGVSGFGHSGDIPDLYRACELDAQAIETAAERTLARSVA
jgi:pyruvate dehydrogenase E1 component